MHKIQTSRKNLTYQKGNEQEIFKTKREKTKNCTNTQR